jgi:hypothetical protein
VNDLGEWRPYTVDRVVEVMTAITDDWWLSGGEALDRFVGRRTREHGDVDVSIPTVRLDAVTGRLAEHWDVRIASRGRLYPLAGARDVHPLHNLWIREPTGGPWRWQVNLEPCDATTWTYRRDDRVTRPRRDAVVTIDGVPCTAPAVQLLWKAKAPAAPDELDRAAVLPLLPPPERAWLDGAIVLAHPSSPWRQ